MSLAQEEKIQIIEENVRPRGNPFFAALATSNNKPKPETAVQRLHKQLKELQKYAEAGDIRGWQGQLPLLQEASEEAGLDEARDLDLRVQIKKLELTLLLAAGRKAKQQAKTLEQKATEAQMTEDEPTSEELSTKAQKLNRLANQLHEQLLSMMA